jgi:hypothetical protein
MTTDVAALLEGELRDLGRAWSGVPVPARAPSAARRRPAGGAARGGPRPGQEPVHQVAQGNRGDPAAGGPGLAPGVDQVGVVRAEGIDARAKPP